jgi:DNA-binding transcriptional ArsR family regulator
MSRPSRNRKQGKPQDRALIFAALGDETRLWLLMKLSAGRKPSISQLTEGSGLTRQAITKHLRVLQGAGLVHSARKGRESRFAFEPEPIEEIKRYLQLVSEHWDQALSRLKAFVER